MDEIYDILSDIINNKRYRIKDNINNLIFTVKICKMNGKEEEYELILNPKPITKERLVEKINDLKNYVISLESLIKQQNNIITEQNNKINEQNNIIKNHEYIFSIQAESLKKCDERITYLENILKPNKIEKNLNYFENKVEENLNYFENKIENNLNYFENSNIINNEIDIGFLINRLELNGKIKNFDLLYSATKDGSNPSNFHKKCDNIINTLTVIQTTKNIIFGGFIHEEWVSYNRSYKDEKAFCFSLNKKKIYNIIEDKYAISCGKNLGPCFYSSPNHIIHFDGNFLTKQQHTCKKPVSYSDFSEDYELNNGEKQFYVKELEIYKIQFQ